MKKVLFLVFFSLFLFLPGINVFASTTDFITYRYQCYKGSTFLKEGSGSPPLGDFSSPGFDISYQCPAGWTNVNFTFAFNLEGIGVLPAWTPFGISWDSTVGSTNSKVVELVENHQCMTNPNAGGLNTCVTTTNADKKVLLTFFGNGGSNAQVIKGFRTASNSDLTSFTNWYNITNNTNLISSNIINSLSQSRQDILNNQNQNKNDILNNQNKNTQDILDSNKEIQDSITDDNVSDSTGSYGDFFKNIQNNTHGLTGIITKPLSLINQITSSSCKPIKLNLMDTDFELPCISTFVYSKFPDLLALYQTITFGLIAYAISINVLAKVREFKNPDVDRIEVIDL